MPSRTLLFPAILSLFLILVLFGLLPWSKGGFAELPITSKVYVMAILLFSAYVYIVRYADDISRPGRPISFDELPTGSYYLGGSVKEIESRTLLLTEVKQSKGYPRKCAQIDTRAVKVPEKVILSKHLESGATILIVMEPNGSAGSKRKCLKVLEGAKKA